ncbi:FusB/FusC family EF-G-binding protein [Vagococcus sp. DIV0080]|uniref:FusB/FusC family EF-G-binding protein n=1 Tax=Candidatus Vagococcus giribetii TaxID=2230876 RepID=A0ABS3HQR5_9ENTE|nr:FusB/FusC family EF-G-binding protein [Vagococcus sp. DIV0080]MBO0476094.1 FusB/FusC family EF-G-binding protein [Vagococcus sp. DIV0080]
MIQPYEFNDVKKQITQLIDIYKTVNDKDTIMTSQAITTNHILPILGEELHESIRVAYLDVRLTNQKALPIFERIKEEVIPFKDVSDKQIEKSFKKVKKLKFPQLADYDLKETNYLAWDDIGTQRKYLSFYSEDKLVSVYGVMSNNVIKNVCAICQKIDNVALFMATTKRSGDETYTKKGNYICKDSQKCNRQMETLKHLHSFYETVSK